MSKIINIRVTKSIQSYSIQNLSKAIKGALNSYNENDLNLDVKYTKEYTSKSMRLNDDYATIIENLINKYSMNKTTLINTILIAYLSKDKEIKNDTVTNDYTDKIKELEKELQEQKHQNKILVNQLEMNQEIMKTFTNQVKNLEQEKTLYLDNKDLNDNLINELKQTNIRLESENERLRKEKSKWKIWSKR